MDVPCLYSSFDGGLDVGGWGGVAETSAIHRLIYTHHYLSHFKQGNTYFGQFFKVLNVMFY